MKKRSKGMTTVKSRKKAASSRRNMAIARPAPMRCGAGVGAA